MVRCLIHAILYRSGSNAQSDTIEVRVEGLSTGDGYNEALERRLDEGTDVDLFIVNADRVKALNARGYFYDLSQQPVYRKLNDAAKRQSTIDGIAYCLPTKMTAYGLYVNVGLLERYGLEPTRDVDGHGLHPAGISSIAGRHHKSAIHCLTSLCQCKGKACRRSAECSGILDDEQIRRALIWRGRDSFCF